MPVAVLPDLLCPSLISYARPPAGFMAAAGVDCMKAACKLHAEQWQAMQMVLLTEIPPLSGLLDTGM